jgi:glutamate-1-semialdehyde 2,1-aminomutase
LGKIIGGGFAIGAVVTSKELLKAFKPTKFSGLVVERPPLSHAGTWNAHPLAMAAGLATFEELTPSAYAHLDEMGDSLRAGMEKAVKKAGILAQISGVGSVFHIYFTDQPVVDSKSAKMASQLLLRYFDLNMITRGIYICKGHCSFISTQITTSEVRQTLEAVEDTFYSMKPLVRKVAPSLIT